MASLGRWPLVRYVGKDNWARLKIVVDRIDKGEYTLGVRSNRARWQWAPWGAGGEWSMKSYDQKYREAVARALHMWEGFSRLNRAYLTRRASQISIAELKHKMGIRQDDNAYDTQIEGLIRIARGTSK